MALGLSTSTEEMKMGKCKLCTAVASGASPLNLCDKHASDRLRGLRKMPTVFDDFTNEVVIIAPRWFTGDVVSADKLKSALEDEDDNR